jgi:hypothetical protein
MRRIRLLLIVFGLFLAAGVHAQKVPDKVLERIIKTYADKGMTLEKSFLPDFKRAHPGNLMYYNRCYPGKKIVVATITASRPADWYFKVSYGNQVASKTHELASETIDGQQYWLDWIITGFPANFSDPSQYCLTIVAYDKNSIDLPVYMYIFSKPI